LGAPSGTEPVTEALTRQAVEGLVGSYLLTRRQRRGGGRESLGGVTVVRYAAGQGRLAADHFFVHDLAPREAVALIRANQLAENHQIHVLATAPDLALAYMAAGCSFRAPAHLLMARELDEPPGGVAPTDGVLRAWPENLALLNGVRGAEPVPDEEVADPDLRFYLALVNDLPVGLVRAGRLPDGVGWVSHLYTDPAYRRRGVGSRLMVRLLQDGRAAGERLSVLLATEMAHGLYRRLGYRVVAPVLDFAVEKTGPVSKTGPV
jgi:ribosomal protein S18 acetylase RimI-like enzyme